jgi:GNAT superfamily N-acetyltransferase
MAVINSSEIRFRIATSADASPMAACRLTDPTAGAADSRMAAYLDGQHHPQQALLSREGYVALIGERIVGYIAGHQTTRYGCEGEVQYLFVAPEHRRRGIATVLLRLMAAWFQQAGVRNVCVCIDADSPSAKPFYEAAGATPIEKLWYVWNDIAIVCR